MIADWRTYSAADFIPFTAEVYFRLIERVNAALWPAQLLALAGGCAVLVLAWRGRARIATALSAAAWAWVGPSFLLQRYGELSWAGRYFGWAFLLEAALLLALAASGRGIARPGSQHGAGRAAGLAAAGIGLAYPLIAPLAARPWLQAETFGIHPDPTAIATLGIGLAALRGPWLWAVLVVPGLWCLAAGVTLQVLGAPWAPLPLAGALLALLGPLLAARRAPQL